MVKAQYVPCDYIIFPGDWHLPDEGLMSWVEANHIDSHAVMADYPIVVRDGNITAQTFVFRDGTRVKDWADKELGLIKTQMVTVPLIAQPEDFGIEAAPSRGVGVA